MYIEAGDQKEQIAKSFEDKLTDLQQAYSSEFDQLQALINSKDSVHKEIQKQALDL